MLNYHFSEAKDDNWQVTAPNVHVMSLCKLHSDVHVSYLNIANEFIVLQKTPLECI